MDRKPQAELLAAGLRTVLPSSVEANERKRYDHDHDDADTAASFLDSHTLIAVYNDKQVVEVVGFDILVVFVEHGIFQRRHL
jgi:hypothetical protein